MVCVIANRIPTSIPLRMLAMPLQQMAAQRVRVRARPGRPAPVEKVGTVLAVSVATPVLRAKRPRTLVAATEVRAVFATKPGCRPKVVRAARRNRAG
jgi:hypothetical protein